MKLVLACCLVLAPLVGAAAQEPAVNISHEDLLAYLGSMQVEARLDADITGDGHLDVVFVARSPDERVLGVIAGGGQRTAQIGRRAIGEARLDPSPQAPAALAFANGVLTVDDLTGAGTVTSARYQYRHDPMHNRMRLFDLVCEVYSPTLSHGSSRLSWNLDLGEHVVELGQVVTLDTGEDVYVYEPGNRTLRRVPPIYMEDTPDPSRLLGDGVNHAEMMAVRTTPKDARVPQAGHSTNQPGEVGSD